MAKLGNGWCDIDLLRTRFYFYFCANFGENRSSNATMRVRTHGQANADSMPTQLQRSAKN